MWPVEEVTSRGRLLGALHLRASKQEKDQWQGDANEKINPNRSHNVNAIVSHGYVSNARIGKQ